MNPPRCWVIRTSSSCSYPRMGAPLVLAVGWYHPSSHQRSPISGSVVSGTSWVLAESSRGVDSDTAVLGLGLICKPRLPAEYPRCPAGLNGGYQAMYKGAHWSQVPWHSQERRHHASLSYVLAKVHVSQPHAIRRGWVSPLWYPCDRSAWDRSVEGRSAGRHHLLFASSCPRCGVPHASPWGTSWGSLSGGLPWGRVGSLSTSSSSALHGQQVSYCPLSLAGKVGREGNMGHLNLRSLDGCRSHIWGLYSLRLLHHMLLVRCILPGGLVWCLFLR